MSPLQIFETMQTAVKHHQAGQLPEAERLYRQILAQQPNYHAALHLLGAMAGQRNRHDEAIALIEQAVALQPNNPNYQSNLGIAFSNQGELDRAVACFERALAAKSDLVDAMTGLGWCLHAQGRFDDAMAHYRRALAINPHADTARFNLASTLLLLGRFTEAWPHYESRLRIPHFGLSTITGPCWDGSPLVGRTILLHAEQGFGDTLQTLRFIPRVVQAGGRVIVKCQTQLLRLLQPLFPRAVWLGYGDPLPAFDVQCPLFSLPGICGITLETIPPPSPLVAASPEIVEKWRRIVAGDGGQLRVGLVWAGRKDHRSDRTRSASLALFAPFGRVPGVTLYSLQKGERAAQPGDLPSDVTLIDHTNDLHDFAQTAGLIANLDLVIAVDTAVAHLAGAMGKPVWTLHAFVAEWRWLLNRSDSPWYPTMRIFRQPAFGDWPGVVDAVVAALDNLRLTSDTTVASARRTET